MKAWAIPDAILKRKDLDMTEKVLIAILDRLGALEKPVWPRQQWLADRMGVTERTIRRTLDKLQEKGIVKYEGQRWKIAQYSLTGHNVRLSEDNVSGQSEDNMSGYKKDIQGKEETNKHLVRQSPSTSAPTSKVSFQQIDLELATLLYNRILDNTPTFKPPNLDAWAGHVRLMRERDNRTPDQIRYLINWCQNDTFWQANILSTQKLRDKFDDLVARAKRDYNYKQQKKSNVAFS